MLALTLPIGLVVGITLGALGGGGSILTVPALVYLLGLDARAATTGSLVIVGITTLIGMLPHQRAGRVRLGQGVVFGLLGVGGAFVGSLLSTAVPQNVLLAAFAGLMARAYRWAFLAPVRKVYYNLPVTVLPSRSCRASPRWASAPPCCSSSSPSTSSPPRAGSSGGRPVSTWVTSGTPSSRSSSPPGSTAWRSGGWVRSSSAGSRPAKDDKTRSPWSRSATPAP